METEGDSREDQDVAPEQDTGGSDAKYGDAISDDSIFFSGQIPGAISTAQTEKKNLIIYIAGDNEDCRKLDEITWKDAKVRELLFQKFVTLRLMQGTVDAAHFAAMYPYEQVPTIAIISNNGKLLKQHGGYISSEDFLHSLNNSIVMQNAAAVVAALASASVAPPRVEHQVQESSSSGTTQSSPVCPTDALSSGSSQSKSDNPLVPSTSSLGSSQSRQEISTAADFPQCHQEDPSTEEVPRSRQRDPSVNEVSQPIHINSKDQGDDDKCEQNNIMTADSLKDEEGHGRKGEQGTPPEVSLPAADRSLSKNPDEQSEKAAESVKPTQKKQVDDTIHLQVRLTNGENIRNSFKPTDRLASVKQFIDNNRTDGNGKYSLAILYPKQLLGQEDMQKSLSELKLEDRATLMLIGSGSKKKKSTEQTSKASTSQATETEKSGGIWKFLSYLNPFSYLSSNKSDGNNNASGSLNWQYEPDPSLREILRQNSARQVGYPDTNVPNSNKDNKTQSKRSWGANVHTLQHDEDENAFKRGNAFWNGNSTQYGGDDSKK